MLVLTRKVDECINIGDEILVRIIDIAGGSVRLGIEAPKEVSVFRNEVYVKIRQENVESAHGKTSDILKAAHFLREKNGGKQVS